MGTLNWQFIQKTLEKEVVGTLDKTEALRQDWFDKFTTDCFIDHRTPLSGPIKRNKLPLFSRPPAREKSSGRKGKVIEKLQSPFF